MRLRPTIGNRVPRSGASGPRRSLLSRGKRPQYELSTSAMSERIKHRRYPHRRLASPVDRRSLEPTDHFDTVYCLNVSSQMSAAGVLYMK